MVFFLRWLVLICLILVLLFFIFCKVFVDGGYLEWLDWGFCLVSCGEGK